MWARSVSFELAALAPHVNMAGHYTLTFIVDSACTALPSEMRTRTYSGDDHGGEQHVLQPAGRRRLGRQPGLSPPSGRHGRSVGVPFDHDHNLPYLVEQIAPNARMEITGYAEAPLGTSGVSTISTPFAGWIEYFGPQRAQT